MAHLTSENYKDGFLIDNETIGGVTAMAGDVFAAYVSHYLTGETYEYREFQGLGEALNFLNQIPRAWKFEAIGCGSTDTSSQGSCQNGSCKGCS